MVGDAGSKVLQSLETGGEKREGQQGCVALGERPQGVSPLGWLWQKMPQD